MEDHKIKSISGASFAGFYYIAFQKSTETITGFYYHQNSEMFQKLSLKHVGDAIRDKECVSGVGRATGGYDFA
ncbi:UNVERIFIED_CONTAM: GID complex subunit 4, VID24 [Siphonaria sp. JEL0065]|nr:GID complex subunit 4, VID24 [Siphonaria sp. JEL0065]